MATIVEYDLFNSLLGIDSTRIDRVATVNMLKISFLIPFVKLLAKKFQISLFGGAAFELIKDNQIIYTSDIDIDIFENNVSTITDTIVDILTEYVNSSPITLKRLEDFTLPFMENKLDSFPELRAKKDLLIKKTMIGENICVASRIFNRELNADPDIIGNKIYIFIKNISSLKKVVDIRGDYDTDIWPVIEFKIKYNIDNSIIELPIGLYRENDENMIKGFKMSFEHKLNQLNNLSIENNPILYPIVNIYQCRLRVLYFRILELSANLAQDVLKKWQNVLNEKFSEFNFDLEKTNDIMNKNLIDKYDEKIKQMKDNAVKKDLFTKETLEKERRKTQSENDKKQEKERTKIINNFKKDNFMTKKKSNNKKALQKVNKTIDEDDLLLEIEISKNKRESSKNICLNIGTNIYANIGTIIGSSIETYTEKNIKIKREYDFTSMLNFFTALSVGNGRIDTEDFIKSINFVVLNRDILDEKIPKLNIKLKNNLEECIKTVSLMTIIYKKKCLQILRESNPFMFDNRPTKEYIKFITNRWWNEFFQTNEFINLMFLIEVFTRAFKMKITEIFNKRLDEYKEWRICVFLFYDLIDMDRNKEHLLAWMGTRIKFVILLSKYQIYSLDKEKKINSQSDYYNIHDSLLSLKLFNKQNSSIEYNEEDTFFFTKMLKCRNAFLTYNNIKNEGMEYLLKDNLWIHTDTGEEELNIFFKEPDDFYSIKL